MEFQPDFKQINQYIDKEELISKIGEVQIYKRFCADFPKDLFCSPLRKDEHPSFGFFMVEGKWLWKDQATDDAGDVLTFVQKLFCIDFKGALQLIAKTFNVEANSQFMMPRIIVRNREGQAKAESERIILDPIERPLNDNDYDIWAGWNVSPNAMHELKIKAADEVWFKHPDKKDFIIWGRYLDTNPIYFWSHPFTSHYKCYRPFEKDKFKKWINNCDNYTDVQGYIQCRIKEFPGRPLILTSSMKEVAFFRTFGYNAMAGHTEGSKFSKDFIRHLFKYCWPIISAYDGDGAGIKAAMFLRKEYNIPLLAVCRAHHKSKDPTDLWREDYHECLNYINRIQETIDYYAIYQRAPGGLDITESVHST